MTRAALALGANLGDRRAALRRAVALLARQQGVMLVSVSGLWQTSAVGGPPQPDFLNAVVLVETSLSPGELLGVAHDIEQDAGRERVVHWGPRTLDVDLLAFDDVRSQSPELTLPHPRAHERAFVLLPWAQVAPQWVLALVSGEPGRAVSEWAAALGAAAPSEPGAGVPIEPGAVPRGLSGLGVELLDAGAWWR